MSTRFAMSKSAVSQIDQATADAQKKYDAVLAAVDAFNETLGKAREDLTAHLEAYDAARGDLASIVEAERDAFQSEFGDKSERWQEGERGSRVSEFIDRLTEIVDKLQEDTSLDLPEDIALEVDSPEDVLTDYPQAAEDGE